MLRTGELLKIRKMDLSLSWSGTPAASLCCTKPNLGSVPPPVKQWSFSMHTWCACWQMSAATWHQRNSSWAVLPPHFGPSLHDSCTKLDSPKCSWKPYSLRRGGATTDFFFTTVSRIAPWSEEGGHPPRQHGSTLTMQSQCKHNLLPHISKIAPWRNGLHGSPSVRPSPKAVVWARSKKLWTQSEGDRG